MGFAFCLNGTRPMSNASNIHPNMTPPYPTTNLHCVCRPRVSRVLLCAPPIPLPEVASNHLHVRTTNMFCPPSLCLQTFLGLHTHVVVSIASQYLVSRVCASGPTRMVHRILNCMFLLASLVRLLVFSLVFVGGMGYVRTQLGGPSPLSHGCLVDAPGVIALASMFVPLCRTCLSMCGVGHVENIWPSATAFTNCAMSFIFRVDRPTTVMAHTLTCASLCIECPPTSKPNSESPYVIPVHDKNEGAN